MTSVKQKLVPGRYVGVYQKILKKVGKMTERVWLNELIVCICERGVDSGGREGGGTVMGNLLSSCLVLRDFAVTSKSPRVWFADSSGRVVSAMGETLLPSIKLGLWIMKGSKENSRVFKLALPTPSVCGTNHSTPTTSGSPLTSSWW